MNLYFIQLQEIKYLFIILLKRFNKYTYNSIENNNIRFESDKVLKNNLFECNFW
jgi:hypothetical protein